MKKKEASELVMRLVAGGIALVILVVFVMLSHLSWYRPLFGIALTILTGVTLWEFYQLGRIKGFILWMPLGIIAGVFYMIVHYLQNQELLPHPWHHMASAVSLGLILFVFFCAFLIRPEHAVRDLAVSFFGIVYVVVPLSLVLDVVYSVPTWGGVDGRWWFFLVIAVTVMTDMGGYFVGRFAGRNKMAAVLSPKKTWEGAIGGVVFGVIAAGVWGYFAWDQTTFWQVLVLGFILTITGQIGDLAESMIKRDAGVKDSNQLPGLGGLLDVMDSLLFNIPVMALYLKVIT